MKAKLVVALFLISTVSLVSCDNDFLPDKEIQNTFNSMFPKAKRVDWDMERGYYVAEFHENGYEKEAWFDSDGIWLLTETDFGRTVPTVISTALATTDYADWRIDDVDFIEMKDKDSFYVVEVEKGEMEQDLYFSETGELLDVKSGAGDFDAVPW